eukprot:scaffold244_cov416-Prasinococcus_capsulatus_cf.AAC.2
MGASQPSRDRPVPASSDCLLTSDTTLQRRLNTPRHSRPANSVIPSDSGPLGASSTPAHAQSLRHGQPEPSGVP